MTFHLLKNFCGLLELEIGECLRDYKVAGFILHILETILYDPVHYDLSVFWLLCVLDEYFHHAESLFVSCQRFEF